jgi:ABC-type glutathione transport system ATPase component
MEGQPSTISNTIMLQQINTTQVCQTSSDAMHETTAAQQAISCASQVPDVPKFVVGLDNPINDVKQILLQNDVNVLGIAGLGGSGKTTLASALCKDTEVNSKISTSIFSSYSPNLHFIF